MPQGVSHLPGRSKPFLVRVRDGRRAPRKFFKTEREAIVALTAHRAIQNVRAKARQEAKRRALLEKRASDLVMHGENSMLERRFALALVDEWRRQTGRPALVLNDNTRGDVLLGLAPDVFLCVQLKTTEKAMKRKKNAWYFGKVLGYASMPVVCWRADREDAWVYDGTALEKRGKEDLCIFRREELSPRNLPRARPSRPVGLLNTRSGDSPSVVEHAARRDFQSASREGDARHRRVPPRFPDAELSGPRAKTHTPTHPEGEQASVQDGVPGAGRVSLHLLYLRRPRSRRPRASCTVPVRRLRRARRGVRSGWRLPFLAHPGGRAGSTRRARHGVAAGQERLLCLRPGGGGQVAEPKR